MKSQLEENFHDRKAIDAKLISCARVSWWRKFHNNRDDLRHKPNHFVSRRRRWAKNLNNCRVSGQLTCEKFRLLENKKSQHHHMSARTIRHVGCELISLSFSATPTSEQNSCVVKNENELWFRSNLQCNSSFGLYKPRRVTFYCRLWSPRLTLLHPKPSRIGNCNIVKVICALSRRLINLRHARPVIHRASWGDAFMAHE